jgi:ribosomal protein S18 acetylase RimI-like enzyme
MPLRIRPYAGQDLDAIINLFSGTVRQVNCRDYTHEQIEAWAPPTVDRERWRKRLDALRTVVAEIDGTIAGFAAANGQGYLDFLYTHHTFLRRGVASALCEEIEAGYRAAGVRLVFTHSSITARPFFQSIGFRVVSERTVQIGAVSLTNYRMEKELAGT